MPTTAPADDSEGSHSWDGRLCDGSPFTIDYTIAHKRVTVDHVEGPSSNIRSVTQGARVSFDDVDGRVTLSMSRRGHLKIDARLGRCDTNVTTTAPPAPTTTVQGTTPTTGNVTTTAMATTTTTAKATTTTAKATTTTAKATTTTQPVPQPKYLTYNLPVGTVVVKLEDPPNRMARWSTKTPGWLYYTSKDSGTSIVIEFQNASTGEKGDFHATLSGGTVTASFTGSGGTVTPAPSSSTVDPGKTNPSG